MMEFARSGGLRRRTRGGSGSEISLNAAQVNLVNRVIGEGEAAGERSLLIGAMEMGSGKTLAALCALCALRGRSAPSGNTTRALFVVPKSTLHDSWHRQRRIFTDLRPDCAVFMTYPEIQRAFLRGWVRSRGDEGRHRPEWVRAGGSKLLEQEWDLIVFDESHTLRNPRRMSVLGTAASIASSGGRRVLCLTGTPIHNGPRDASGQLRAMVSGSALEDPAFFGAHFTLHADAVSSFNSRFVFSATLADAGVTLPAKRSEILWVDHGLSGENALAYNSALAGLRGAKESGAKHHLLSMRQLCMDTALFHKHGRARFDDEARRLTIANPGPKLRTAVELTRRLVFEGHEKIVIVSEFVTLLEVFRGLAFSELGETCLAFDGRLSAQSRKEVVDDFLTKDSRLLCLSLCAGAFGLNLVPGPTAMIILGVWYNPAMHRQVEARIHRIGQEKPVVVYTLVARGTIEAAILATHEYKENCATEMLATGSSRTTLEKGNSTRRLVDACQPLL
jgi:SNF2 family DNA or RNA helicase